MTVSQTALLHKQSHDNPDDAKQEIMDALGDLSEFEIFGNQILVADYVRPAVTKSGLKLPGSHLVEDIYQGKVALVVKLGYSIQDLTSSVELYGQDGLNAEEKALLRKFGDSLPEVGDWVYFMPQQSVQCAVCGPGSKMAMETRSVPIEREVRDGVTKIVGHESKTERVREWEAGWPCRLVYAKDLYGRVPNPGMLV